MGWWMIPAMIASSVAGAVANRAGRPGPWRSQYTDRWETQLNNWITDLYNNPPDIPDEFFAEAGLDMEGMEEFLQNIFGGTARRELANVYGISTGSQMAADRIDAATPPPSAYIGNAANMIMRYLNPPDLGLDEDIGPEEVIPAGDLDVTPYSGGYGYSAYPSAGPFFRGQGVDPYEIY